MLLNVIFNFCDETPYCDSQTGLEPVILLPQILEY